MSDETSGGASSSGPHGTGTERDAASTPGEASERERAEAAQRAYEEELSKISSTDMVLQATVSLLNVGGRRLGLAGGGESERDLEQVRDAIDAVRGLIPVLERRVPNELRPLRDALSQLQMIYAREATAVGEESGRTRGGPGAAAADAPPTPTSGQTPPRAPGASEPSAREPGPGPAESSGRLWVPGR